MKKNILLILITIIFGGCAAALIPHTNDPMEKTYWANELLKKGRALPAEKLIIEAIEICQENNNSKCLGNAYSMYGFFFRSHAVERYEGRYKEKGFYDKSATYENRFTQSKKYFEKAIAEFLKTNEYDMLTNTYVELGHTYYFLKDKKLECESYDTSLKYNKKFFQKKPKAKISLPKEYATYDEYIAMEKERAKCP